LLKTHKKWLKCVLLPLVMNMIYSYVISFPMNEIFKSKISLKQELNGTKKSENSLVPH